MISIETLTYYTATKKYELSFPSLETDLDVDVVVIGGGFSGINTVLELAEHGIVDIVVLKARHLDFGGVRRSSRQIMAGTGHDLGKIRKDVGEDDLRAIFGVGDLGAGIIKGRIEKYVIDADFCHDYGYMDFDACQVETLQAQEKESRLFGSPYEIRYLYSAEMRQIISSDVYGSTLLHMGDGRVRSLSLLLGKAKALVGLDARVFEYSPALEAQYGERTRVCTARGSVTVNKLLWACGSFLNRLEPELYRTTIDICAFQMMTKPLSDGLIQRISPIRGVYSDIRPVIDYYRVTNGNRLLLGVITPFVECIPDDLKAQNHKLMLKIFPYLERIRIDLVWGGPVACSANLFPRIGSLSGRPNTFFVQSYSEFGVAPGHIVCEVLAEDMSEDSARYGLLNSVRHIPIHGKDRFRPLLFSAGRTWHRPSGYRNGRCWNLLTTLQGALPWPLPLPATASPSMNRTPGATSLTSARKSLKAR